MAFKSIKKNESCNYFFKIILKKTIKHLFLSLYEGFRLKEKTTIAKNHEFN